MPLGRPDRPSHGRRAGPPRIAPAGAALALTACSGVQTVLDPAGPEAGRIAGLAWLLFIGGAAIFILTMGLAALALRAPGRLRRVMGSRRFVLWGGIAFPLLALSALLLHSSGIFLALARPAGGEPLRIAVTGHQFWWEVRYPDTEGAITANEIHIPVGRPIELSLTTVDVIHSLWIPNLHGKLDMIPGHVNRLRLQADRPGKWRGQCAEYCGLQHALMAFWVVAEQPAAFDRWLERQRAPVEPPAEAFLAHGMQVFGEAGCGACHAVRGTPWDGRWGPDLSRLGSRLSLGAGALENHRGTLAGWIAGTQDIKPGNAMPAYARALEPTDLRALAAWLESLR